MKKRNRSLTLAAALIAITTLSTHAQTWETFLPRPEIQEASGTQVLIDPFADPANPGPFIGSRAGKILQMEPLDATTYLTTLMSDGVGAVFRMDFSPADFSAYAAGDRPLVTTPPFP
jgi:hypothetical protein